MKFRFGLPRGPEKQKSVDRRWEKRFELFFERLEERAQRIESGENDSTYSVYAFSETNELQRLSDVRREIEERVQSNPESDHRELLEKLKVIETSLPLRELAGNEIRVKRFLQDNKPHLVTAFCLRLSQRFPAFWEARGVYTEEVRVRYEAFTKTYILPSLMQLFDTALLEVALYCSEDVIPKGAKTKRDEFMPMVNALRVSLTDAQGAGVLPVEELERLEQKYDMLNRRVGLAEGDRETGDTKIKRDS